MKLGLRGHTVRAGEKVLLGYTNAYLATVDVLDSRLSEEEVHVIAVLHRAHKARSWNGPEKRIIHCHSVTTARYPPPQKATDKAGTPSECCN